MSDSDLRRLFEGATDESNEADRVERIVARAGHRAGRGDITRLIGVQGWAGLFLILIGVLEVLLGSKNIRERQESHDKGEQ